MMVSISQGGQMPSSGLACLRCRKIGHVFKNCPGDRLTYGSQWFFSDARRALDWFQPEGPSKICQRCRELDIVQLLHQEVPWVHMKDVQTAAIQGSHLIRSIGQAGSLELRIDCSVCRCLFTMLPTPRSPEEEVVILPLWTMNRLTGENGAPMDREEKRQYKKCLLAAVKPNPIPNSFWIDIQRSEALCIMEEDDRAHGKTLGGRLVAPNSLNMKVIAQWLSTCDRLHAEDCDPVYTDELRQIRLIDITTRQIVEYPQKPCKYIALSYVWGGKAQQSFELGSILPRLPQTIEDAISCVTELGYRYLWIDSVCINQSNREELQRQINIMGNIYQGAYITLINLSGDSVESGFSKIGRNKRSVPQMYCEIDGKRLVGLSPTLSHQLWVSPWALRAWTMQEAWLSRRLLYVSDHELYFECRAMQCCESLDQANSWAHNRSRNSSPNPEKWLAWIAKENGTGCYRNNIDNTAERIKHWGSIVSLYCYRFLTYDYDALNALTGILNYMAAIYEGGFFWGLPVADFQWGLLWMSQWPPERRDGFPTWSFVGWKGGMWHSEPLDATRPHQFPVPLRIWKVCSAMLEDLFTAPGFSSKDISKISNPFPSDPLSEAGNLEPDVPDFHIEQYPMAEERGYLFLEVVIFNFTPYYGHPKTDVRINGQAEYFEMSISGTPCKIVAMSTDRERDGCTRAKDHELLVLARDRFQGWVCYFLLLVHVRGQFAERSTSLRLLIPDGQHSHVVKSLRPQKRRLVLS